MVRKGREAKQPAKGESPESDSVAPVSIVFGRYFSSMLYTCEPPVTVNVSPDFAGSA